MTNLEKLENTISELLDDQEAWTLTDYALRHSSGLELWIGKEHDGLGFQLWEPTAELPKSVVARLWAKTERLIKRVDESDDLYADTLQQVNEILGITKPDADADATVEAPTEDEAPAKEMLRGPCGHSDREHRQMELDLINPPACVLTTRTE